MTWATVRVDAVAPEVRESIDPSIFGDDEVNHWSIPALDATGFPNVEPASSIGSTKIRLTGEEILVSRLNPRKARVVRIPTALDGLHLCSGEFVVLRPTAVEPRFLEYALRSEKTRQQFDANVQSVTRSHQRMRPEQVRQLQLIVPTRPRQRAIADFLDAETARIDALIAKKRQLVGALEQRRAGEIEEVIAGAPADSYLVSGVNLPYTSAPLKRLLAATLPGGTPDTSDQGYWADTDASDGLPWVAIGDMVDRGVTATTAKCVTKEGLGASRLTAAPAGTLLFAMYASVGKLTILGMPAVWNQAILGLVPRADHVSVRYLALWLEVLRPHLSAIARSNTQDNLNAEQVANMPVPLRSRKEQDRVVARLLPRLSRFSTAQLSLNRQIALLRERRQALITAAVSGELDLCGEPGPAKRGTGR